ncbi:MAG TPA: hypothetical protein VMC61_06050 [Methanocella sp.]|nr:hypothetical protein [Methanocella sp.]
MDIVDSLYGFFSTSDPATLLLELLVAVVLAVSLVYLALELYRIYREYAGKEAPAPAVSAPPPMEAMKAPEAPKAVVPSIDVVKGSLSESMMTLTQKYRLESLTLASQDGLVIASTGKAPDQDAAVYSGLFQELYKVKHEPYYYVESKEVSLYALEGGSGVGVAHRKGAFSPEEIKAIREDTRKVIDRFAAGGRK